MKKIERFFKEIEMWFEYLFDKLFSYPWNDRICWTILIIAGVWLVFLMGGVWWRM